MSCRSDWTCLTTGHLHHVQSPSVRRVLLSSYFAPVPTLGHESLVATNGTHGHAPVGGLSVCPVVGKAGR